MPDDKIRILYIGGSHRSGSTLLERLLAHVQGVVSLGELMSIWGAGFIENLLCGCGEPFRSCQVWQQIIVDGFGNKMESQERVRRVNHLARELSRSRRLMQLGSRETTNNTREFIGEYVKPLYYAIQKWSKAKVIVDPSNAAWYLDVLTKCDFVDLYFLHLVRDSRAVVYSYKRKKRRPEFGDTKVYMPTHSSFTSLKDWMLNNYASLKIKQSIPFDRYKLLSYDNMVSSPKETVIEVMEFIGLTNYDLSYFVDENRARLASSHSIMGNPMRFQTGVVEISDDNEWKQKLDTSSRLATSILTYPLLKKFGFL